MVRALLGSAEFFWLFVFGFFLVVYFYRIFQFSFFFFLRELLSDALHDSSFIPNSEQLCKTPVLFTS